VSDTEPHIPRCGSLPLLPGLRAAALLLDGSFRADVLLAGDDTFPESVRVAALGRLADRCPPRRWPRIREGLAADPQTVWRERVLAAVAYVTWVLAPTLAPELFGADVPPLFTADEALGAFATFLAPVVTDDVAAARRPSAPRFPSWDSMGAQTRATPFGLRARRDGHGRGGAGLRPIAAHPRHLLANARLSSSTSASDWGSLPANSISSAVQTSSCR